MLLAVFLFIVFANYPRQGWLLGWDNVVPEFNFKINFLRGLSVWQENQGLGVIGGHGFASTLPHTLIQFLLSFFFPISHLRPIFTLLMVATGTLGSFFLTAYLLGQTPPKDRYPFALIASLYYMLNFGTVQMFYIPLEGFTFHYAFLPWLLFTLLRFFRTPTFRNLLLFAVISVASSGQGFIPPLFVIYLMFLGLSAAILLFADFSWLSLRKIILICLVTLFANAYWAFPVGFYAKERSDIYLKAYNNLQTTEDFVYRSTKFGDLSDVVNLKGFIYEAVDGFVKGEAKYIYQPWIDHFAKPAINVLSFVFFGFGILGIIIAFKNGNAEQIILSLCYLVSFTFLATNVPPFSYISNLLRNDVPVFKQAFRISFTKFSISLALFYGVFLGLGAEFLFLNLLKKIRLKQFLNIPVILLIALIIYWTSPSFTGNYFYKATKLDLPESYLDLFAFFKDINPHQKIADFPQISPEGWTKYRWGYIGSGFLWYGLPQPILDRNFDVWGNYNENYYWEVSQAVYSKNRNQFASILSKYDVDWVVIDSSFLGFFAPRAVYLNQLADLLNDLKNAELVRTFGDLKVYHIANLHPPVNNIKILSELPLVSSDYKWNNFDKAYLDIGDYKDSGENSDNSEDKLYYPFRSLFTGRDQNELEFNISEDAETFYLKTEIPTSYVGSYLRVPPFNTEDIVEVNKDDLSKIQKNYPEIYLDGERIAYQYSAENYTVITLPYINKGELVVKIPKIGGLFSYSTPDGISKDSGDYYKCDNFKAGTFAVADYLGAENKTILNLKSANAAVCFARFLPDLPQRLSYIFSVTSRNLSGKELSFWLENQQARKAEIDTLVKKTPAFAKSYFIQAPLESFGAGYTVHIKNTSIGDNQTANEVSDIEVHMLPFRFLTGLHIANKKIIGNLKGKPPSLTEKISVYHPDLSFYRIIIPDNQDIPNPKTLILSQSYDSGWNAYQVNDTRLLNNNLTGLLVPFLSQELASHFMVNNWENGWDISNIRGGGKSVTFVVIYMPQYFEYLGFLLIFFLPLLFVLRKYLSLK